MPGVGFSVCDVSRELVNSDATRLEALRLSSSHFSSSRRDAPAAATRRPFGRQGWSCSWSAMMGAPAADLESKVFDRLLARAMTCFCVRCNR